MSMRQSNKKRSICEVLGEINDLHQGDTVLDILTRKKLAEAEQMAKKIVLKLIEYSKACNKDSWIEWESSCPGYEELLVTRTKKSYLAED